jgi:hypothetical protein
MTVINTADKIYVGSSLASKVYSGTNLVWPVVTGPDAATTAWINAVVAAGGSVSGSSTTGRQKLVDDLIKGLKADGIWAKLDRLWIFAAENTKSALIDLVTLSTANPTTLLERLTDRLGDRADELPAALAAPVFTVDRGYTCGGSATVNTGYIPATHGVQYTVNTAHASIWSLTAAQSDSPAYTDSISNIFPRLSDNNAYFRLNYNAGGGASNTDGTGFFVADRNAASGTSCMLGYRNGSLLQNDYTGTYMLATGPVYAWDREIAAIGAGGTLNSTQHTAYYNRLRTYMTAVGVP